MSLPYPRRIESGPWFSAGRAVDGETVHQRLRDARPANGDTARPYCVYVHVPFCASICSFCALYTRAVPPDADQILDEYIDLVERSLETHPWRQPSLPPTTVHFGGGTPLFLGISRFSRLVRALVGTFGTSRACEWAVETTTSSLDEHTVDALERLGFQRIHLGIQTLDNPIRTKVGRHETGEKAIERIRGLQARGFFTSVDLIIGFDESSSAIVEDDLHRLYDAGVRMFSICELRESGTTRLGIHDLTERAANNYRLWNTIWDFMAAAGLAPIHLGQFARTQADNLYFTHPARGESCIAIGPYAHGCTGDLYYGNRLLPDYYDALRTGKSPIGIAVDYGEDARSIRQLERDLLAQSVARPTIERVERAYPKQFPQILESWLHGGLLRGAIDTGTYVPTADGSWFVGNMIHDARAMLHPVIRMHKDSHP